MTYTVWSRSKNSGWVIERSYTLKSYAQDVAIAIRKSGRLVRVMPKGKKPQ